MGKEMNSQLVSTLREMSRYGTVSRIDAPYGIKASILREVQP